ncbi:MAG: flagellar export protein FliJ [Eubacteriales bacterium]
MNKYKFEFEELLNIKSQKEDNIKNNLSKENKILQEKKDTLNRIIELKKEEQNKFNNKGKTIKISDIEIFYDYIDKLEEKITLQKNNIKIQEKKVDNIRKHLVEISKEKQILEKIKEEDLEYHKKEILYEEQKTNDEIVNYRYFVDNI